MLQVEIRAAGALDAQAMGDIIAASWKVGYKGLVPQGYLDSLEGGRWEEGFRDKLGSGTLQGLLLLEDGRPAGCAVFGAAQEESMAGCGEIVCLYVHPAYWRKGYGARLLEHAQRELLGQGYERLCLHVLRGNKPARRLYERMGFVHAGRDNALEIQGEQVWETLYTKPRFLLEQRK